MTKLFAQVSHQVDEHEDMPGELQLMKDLEMYERILRTDVPSGKAQMHGCWSEFVVRQSLDTDGKQLFQVNRTRGCVYSSLHDTEFIKLPIEAESDSRYVWKLRKALNDLLSTTVDDRRGRAPRDSSRRPQRPSPKRYAFLTSSQGKTVEGVICEYSESRITGH